MVKTSPLHIREMYNIFIKCDNAVRKSADFLSDDEAQALLAHTDDFLLCQNWLLKDSLASNQCLYAWTIKMHYMWHSAYMARYGNPRLLWCYPFEDWMGRCVTSAKACMAGTCQTLLGNKVLANALLVLELSLRAEERLRVRQ